MQIPLWLFEIGLWLAVIGVGLGATYLMIVLGLEWIRKELW